MRPRRRFFRSQRGPILSFQLHPLPLPRLLDTFFHRLRRRRRLDHRSRNELQLRAKQKEKKEREKKKEGK